MIFEDRPRYDFWLKILFIVIPFGLLATGLTLSLNGESEGLPVLAGEALLLFFIFYFVMPRRYQIYQDKLRIVLGGPLAINITLSTILEAKHTSGAKAFGYAGVRFATSSKYVVEIVRTNGWNYVISPEHGDLFVERLNQAIAQVGRYGNPARPKK